MLSGQGRKVRFSATRARGQPRLRLLFEGGASSPLKLSRWALLGLAAAAFTTAWAEEKKGESPALQALVAKTPGEKAKAESLVPSYPLKTCFVSGDNLEDPVDALYGDRLLRFCCKGCLRSFNKNPAKFLPRLDAAEKPVS